MTKIFPTLLLSLLLTACGSPNDIVLGPEPLKQIAEQGDKFKRMPEEDRSLLVAYLGLAELGKKFGADIKSPTGRTVGEVMVDAKAWKEKLKAAAEVEKVREAEAAVLKAKVDADRKIIEERFATIVTIAVIDKVVLPKNYDVGRYSELLLLRYALENKSDKAIRQIKGTVIFSDATGDLVGDLPVDIDMKIPAGKTVKTDTGRGWKTNQFANGDIEKIAGRDFDSMKAVFRPQSIAFEGGEVLKAPQ